MRAQLDSWMFPKPQKAIKFVRKEYQASEQIRPNQHRPEQKNTNISAEEAKFRRDLEFFHYDADKDEHKLRRQGRMNPQRRPLIEEQQSEGREKHIRFASGAGNDKKINKIVIPQNFQKIDLVSQIENRLISCLERKKPYMSVKELIGEDDLKSILGKKQRKIQTKNGDYNQKLNIEPQSLRKIQKRSKQIKHIPLNVQMKINEPLIDLPLDELPMVRVDELNQTNLISFEQDSFFQEFEPMWFDMNYMNQDTHQNRGFNNEKPKRTKKQMAEDGTFIESQFFQRQPIPRNLFISEEKQPKEKKQFTRFDLRNLKVPKLTSMREDKRPNWKLPPINTILESGQEEANHFYPMNSGSPFGQSYNAPQPTASIFTHHYNDDFDEQWSYNDSMF